MWEIPMLPSSTSLADLTLDRLHRLGPWIVVRLHCPCALRRPHSESVTKEIKCLLLDVYYPRFLCIQREAKPIKNLLSLSQIKIRLPIAENHKVIGITNDVSIVLSLAVPFALPIIVQPMEVQISQ